MIACTIPFPCSEGDTVCHGGEDWTVIGLMHSRGEQFVMLERPGQTPVIRTVEMLEDDGG